MAGKREKLFWEITLGGAVGLPAVLIGAAHGAYNAATGNGSFGETFSETTGNIVGAVGDFGSEHADELTKGAIQLTGRAVKGAVNSAQHHHHNGGQS